jgi:5-(carboxyamino)imidazole ribonucleotide mutase
MSKKVAVIMGSDSDFPVVKSALTELKKYGVEFECRVMSAHRTPAEAIEFTSSAKENGFGVIICAAGMAAHLAGVVAGNTTLPVIGIPMKSSVLDGMDALLSTVMMPPGVPVATVAINGAKNAAVLAVQILALADNELAARLESEKKAMADGVREKDAKLQAEINNL